MKRIVFWILSALLTLFTAIGGAPLADDADVKAVMARVTPSLVKVVAENGKRFIATGVAIGEDEVLTSTLPFRQEVHRVFVETAKGVQLEAEVIGKDWPAGLAMLRLKRKALTPVALARGVEAGDWVALVGIYQTFPAVYQGIVSSVSDDELLLNAPVAPGAAGGAVVNRQGELVGVIRGSVGFAVDPDYTYRDHQAEIEIRAAKAGGPELCFALPLGQLNRLAAELRQYGRVKRAWIGMSVVTAGAGLTVEEVLPASPAQKGGLLRGDELLTCRGQAVRTPFDLSRVMQTLSPGETVALQVRREGKPRSVELVVGQAPDRSLPHAPAPVEETFSRTFEVDGIPDIAGSLPEVRKFVLSLSGSRKIGIDVLELTPELAKKLGSPTREAVIVSKVSPGSAGQRAGLRVGDLVVRAGTRGVARLDDLRRSVERLKDGEVLRLDLIRDGKTVSLSLLPDRIADPDEGGGSWNALVPWERIWNGIEQGLAKAHEERLTGHSRPEPTPADLRREVQRLQADRDRLAEMLARQAKDFKALQERLRELQNQQK